MVSTVDKLLFCDIYSWERSQLNLTLGSLRTQIKKEKNRSLGTELLGVLQHNDTKQFT